MKDTGIYNILYMATMVESLDRPEEDFRLPWALQLVEILDKAVLMAAFGDFTPTEALRLAEKEQKKNSFSEY